jgi:hypothetical protein
MGLDIYLHAKDYGTALDTYSRAFDEVYDSGRWAAMTDAEKGAWRSANPRPSSGEVPSERYPEHLFNRRYLRSSYNDSGFNHAVPSLLGSADGTYPNERGSLYWIFEPMGREWDGDEGTLTAEDIDKLRESKARALQVADELRKSDRLRVMTASPNVFREPPTVTDDQALAKYREAVAAGRIQPDGWWSNADMDVFGDGLAVLAAIPGKATFGIPGVHLIYRLAEDVAETYIQSAEITAEFCDEAIGLIERDGSCSMSWSG